MATSAERQRAFRERKREQGFVSVTVMVRADQVPGLVELAKALMHDEHLSCDGAMLRNLRTGRLGKVRI